MISPKKVLVTGAGGFIGKHLVPALDSTGYDIIAQSRHKRHATAIVVGDTDEVNLADVDAIVHLAGIAHSGVGEASRRALHEFNVEETLALYNRALEAKVPKFIWLSSSKVLGDAAAKPLPIDAPYNPSDAYAESKVRAEEALLELNGDALDIIRPPLVYGAEVKANFLALLKAGLSGLPLPLGKANAPRAWVAVENLNALVLRLLSDQTSRCVWHVRDQEETSVANMLRRIRSVGGLKHRLFGVPESLMRVGASILGRSSDVDRLFAPLRLDIEDTCNLLNWQPPIAQSDAIRDVVT